MDSSARSVVRGFLKIIIILGKICLLEVYYTIHKLLCNDVTVTLETSLFHMKHFLYILNIT